ncbi:ABC transporter permease [Gluconacetobacter liquefaciens]|uniref:ABC transporter permease n=1 Tax=Gluconacetobacter liquefaciens TaxID=89584 RepID=A0A370G3J7_GLULI|nr:ABC transporter permease [Gluconacetobacter liquefaciens]MBB2186814.1 ABC transporter permease [Gluconacetobacter liquefaciens]RDI37770.1 peptide/nickel transport system permease protein [Gluconacetobacter liquefaciens]GBR05813.1 dipeptide/oligopeptide/nickel ABC transporter permease [Gluconacetobacter liquefaciens NRIC 0522]GEB38935.1 ABC transporter permease [Gluconacetobacter liquefaciens]
MTSLSLAPSVDRLSFRRRLPRPGHLGPAAAVLFLVLLTIAALAPHLLIHTDPLAIAPREAFHAPSMAHPFGTDQSGRDILARVIYGARQSLTLGCGAIALSLSIATILALIGGLGGRIAEQGVRWLIDILFAFPVLVLALLCTATLGSGIGPLIVAIGVGSAAGYTRMVFGQVLSVRDAGYVEAARALGHSPARIVVRHILPNAFRPLVVTATMGVGQTVVWSAALSFLGLGAPPPAAEWGTMLSMGRDFIAEAWWMTFFPGLAIVVTMLSTTIAGRALQRAIEGRGS